MISFFNYLPTKSVTRIWHGQLVAAFMILATAVVFIMPKASLGQTDWTRFESNPVLDVGADGAWDDGGVWHHTVLFHNDEYHLWYTNSNATAIGYARSSDKINWIKDASNPVLESDPVLLPGPSGSWDDADPSQSKILFDGTTFHMWYIGRGGSSDNKWRIGYATAPLDTLTTVLYKSAYYAARGFSKEQNYPNPFNPYTTIQYSLAKPEHVSIKIYNLAGQDITTLVDKKQLAGHHGVIWQPADLPSGIYIYRMQIQEYIINKDDSTQVGLNFY